MSTITPPSKPFPSYKWRWAVLTPTESLNQPPIFLGVLRVFNANQGLSPGATAILNGLAQVQAETHAPVNLVRTSDRNLIRNSGQYWKALGLIVEAHGQVILSPFGQALAEGKITQVEFATTIVKTLELPNKLIENEREWVAHGLVIKPLQLILDILADLALSYSLEEAYITPLELRSIVIPLAGSQAPLGDHVAAIIQYRSGTLNISRFPDCTPESNDKRMAREFLLFLSNYGFCHKQDYPGGNDFERYELASISKEEIFELIQMPLTATSMEDILVEIRATQIPANVERKRVFREVINRPYQNIFRKNTLRAFRSTCLITGVNIDNVLEAAHIIPVSENGADTVDNCLCLRSDIHQLYDTGHLRLFPNGDIQLSSVADTTVNYNLLPKNVTIPSFVDRTFLDWRVKYF